MGSEEFGDFMVNESGEVIDKWEMEAFTKKQEEDLINAIKRAREIRK